MNILYEIFAVLLYFTVLTTIGFLSYRRLTGASDFIIGNRSLNFWLTALAAHASDMSSWLFMGYPAKIFSEGVIGAWAAIGLIVFMYLNWQLVAPKIRIATEKYNSLTFSSFFESHLHDTSGVIRIFTSLMCIVFYTIYISSGLIGLGILIETLFPVSYSIGVCIGTLLVIPYVFLGGYRMLALIDLFQGIFLMLVILFVPLYLIPQLGGFKELNINLAAHNLSTSLIPNLTGKNVVFILLTLASWGLGYFGQPHIVTKFMGIKDVKEMSKSKYVGMSWMTLSLGAATLVGIVGVSFFTDGLSNPEEVFIRMVRTSFPPFLIGLFLCGVIATTINAMSSQVLVLSSSITEDLYKRITSHRKPSSKELLFVSRVSIVIIAFIALLIGLAKLSSIYELVMYAWSGLGASFGPLLILCLYSRRVNKYGAWAGILSGGIVSATWPLINKLIAYDIPILIPSFTISFCLILIVSSLFKNKALATK